MNILMQGKQVFEMEIEALQRTAELLDDVFVTIVERIIECQGKVILTGIGKPGHIARKLAATFASLGVPSFYLHPAEAMHGDLGMVDKKDIVIMISYSGESEEIVRIIPGIKMSGALVIGITGNAESSLANYCDIVQVLPRFREACYLGLAPTSSTTVSLCYGDALAVAASVMKGFQKDDFGKRHPAGVLGKRLLLRVSDLMTSGNDLPIVSINTSLVKSIECMSSKGQGCVVVVNDKGKLEGFFTDGDLRRVVESRLDIYNVGIGDVMTRHPKVIEQDVLALDALRYMKDERISNLPVLDDKGGLCGIITWQMIIRAGIML